MIVAAEPDTSSLFLEFSRHKLLGQYWPRLRECVSSMTNEQVWWRPNEASNSVGNLLLHLDGNVRQWLVASFSELEDVRDRNLEFQQTSQLPAVALLERLGATMREAAEVLSRLTEKQLLASYVIQGYSVHGLDAVYQVIEHFGLHYGQILYIAKALQGRDLGLYSELNATGRVAPEAAAGVAP